MVQDPRASTSSGDGKQTWALALRALQAIGSAVGFVGFLVALGASLTWIRFWAAGLPADQAISTIGRWELVTSGTLVLIVFALAGGIAVLATYLIDRRATGTRRMGTAVVVISVAEMLVALYAAHPDTLGWAVGLAGYALVAWAAYAFVRSVAAWWPQHDRLERARDRVVARRYDLDHAESDAETALAIDRLRRATAGLVRCLTDQQNPVKLFPERNRRWAARDSKDRKKVNRKLDKALDKRRTRASKRCSEVVGTTPGERDRQRAGIRESLALDEANLVLVATELTLARDSILRVPFRRRVASALELAGVVATVVVFLVVVRELRWLVLLLTIAMALNIATLFVSQAARFVWYGTAMVVSVTLFGTAVYGVSAWRHPHLQPVAVLRKHDHAIVCGLYMAETSKRVYIGRVHSEPGAPQGDRRSGQIFWIPETDVEMVKIGTLQALPDANRETSSLASEIIADAGAGATDSQSVQRNLRNC